jgi:hypothetical protein
MKKRIGNNFQNKGINQALNLQHYWQFKQICEGKFYERGCGGELIMIVPNPRNIIAKEINTEIKLSGIS